MKLFFCEHIYIFLLDKCIREELLVVNIMRNCLTIFQHICMILQLTQMRVLVVPHLPSVLQSKSLCELFQWVCTDTILILIYILLITTGVEKFFVCLFVICISSLVKFLLSIFWQVCLFYIIENSLYNLDTSSVCNIQVL